MARMYHGKLYYWVDTTYDNDFIYDILEDSNGSRIKVIVGYRKKKEREEQKMNVLEQTQQQFNQVYDNEYQLLVAKYYEEINHADFIIIKKSAGFIATFSASNTGIYDASSNTLLANQYELEQWIMFLKLTKEIKVND